jgi:4'-phosphopantetheinyl transferase
MQPAPVEYRRFRIEVLADDRELRAVLSNEERARLDKFKLPQAAAQFLQTRARLRRWLGERLNLPPESLRFELSERGKPRLMGEYSTTGLEFSVSHSGDWGIMALSTTGPVGIDIERHDTTRDFDALARRFFSTEEADALRATPHEAERIALFYALWTAKEALAKATGEGLAMDFRAFSVLPEAGLPHVPVVSAALPQLIRDWSVFPLTAPEGYGAALAVPAGALPH